MPPKKLLTDTEIRWPAWNRIVNETFVPLMTDRSRFLILYGGRGSGKSRAVAAKLLYLCLKSNHFRCLLIRNVLANIRESCFKDITDLIDEFNLNDLFTINTHALEIICIGNQNKFVGRGLDEPKKLKSLKDFSHAWIEEEIPISAQDLTIISTTIRTKKADYLQIIFSINPEVPGGEAYVDNWFYQKFFDGHYSPDVKSYHFSNTTELIVDKRYKTSHLPSTTTEEITVHHSTYLDNQHIPDSFKGEMERLKMNDWYLYMVYCLGLWGNKNRGGLFYGFFDRGRDTVLQSHYDPHRPLHLSVDENSVPYMAGVVFQFQDDDCRILHAIAEIKTEHPNNNVAGLAKEFRRMFYTHGAGLYLYGDVSLRKKNTLVEAGWNGIRVLESELQNFRPTVKIASVNPNVDARKVFINKLFRGQIPGCTFLIAEQCKTLLTDLMEVQEDKDGKKAKQKVKVKGQSYERLAHHSDAMDYGLTQIFSKEFYISTNGNIKRKPVYGVEPLKLKFGY